MLEDLGVFQRIGDATDVVTKEMYDFVDKGGRHIALRPELTASVCRAFVQHRPLTPWKVWYAGSQFRYEKPQRGRYRQFDQVGIEVLGADDPLPRCRGDRARLGVLPGARLAPGAAVAQLARRARRPRPLRRRAARRTSNRIVDSLSADSQVTLDKNALRVLDSKRPSDAAIIAAAPRIAEFYSPDAAAHFDGVQAGLSGNRHPVHDRRHVGARPRLLPSHDVRIPRRHARLRAERARRRRPLRRAGRVARRPADARHRLRARPRPHADRLRRRRRVPRRNRWRSMRSSSTPLAASRRCDSPPSCAPRASPPTGPTRTAA